MLATVDWKDPDYEPVYDERNERVLALRALSPKDRARVHAHYAKNPIDWINDWAHTWDQNRRIRGRVRPLRPFLLFPRQVDLVNAIHDANESREDLVVEKTREVGVSWCAVAYGVWMWLYVPGCTVGYGSYSQDRVDELGNTDSLLEKCRIILRNLPPEALPPGINLKKGGDLLKDHLVNPATGAQIIGEVGHDKIGRGAKASIYFVDEYAFLKDHDGVDAALSMCTQCVVFISTAHGAGAFYHKTLNPAFRQFRFEWPDDPRKDQAWYDAYCAKWGPTTTAREVDIDHLASIEDLVIEPKWITAATRLRAACAEAGIPLPLKESFKTGIGGLDVGGGASPSVFTARFGPYVNTPRPWLDKDQGTVTGQKALMWARRQRTQFLHYDAPGVGKSVSDVLRMTKPEDRTLEPIADAEPAPPPPDESDGRRAQRTIDDLFATDVEQVELLAGKPDAPSAEVVKCRGVNTGESPTTWVKWPDGRTSKKTFHNLRAEIWWIARDRFEKTHEMYLWVTKQEGGVQHPLEDCIFLPDCEQLCKELAGPTWHLKPSGKIGIESKDDLKARGVKSPDHADSFMLTLVPLRPGAKVVKPKGYF